MRDNLVESWKELAPEEANPRFTLQYLQDRIGDRGWQCWTFQNVARYDTGVYCRTDEATGMQIKFCTTKRNEKIGLLQCYVAALARCRPFAPGEWTHVKGGIYMVGGVAKYFSSDSLDPLTSIEDFRLVEDPSACIRVSQSIDGSFEYKDLTDPSQNYGDRVFYVGDTGLWARELDSFLGINEQGAIRFKFNSHYDHNQLIRSLRNPKL